MDIQPKRLLLVSNPNYNFIYMMMMGLGNSKVGFKFRSLTNKYGSYSFSGFLVEIETDKKLNEVIQILQYLDGNIEGLVLVDEYRNGQKIIGIQKDGQFLTQDLGRLADITNNEEDPNNAIQYYKVGERKYAFENPTWETTIG